MYLFISHTTYSTHCIHIVAEKIIQISQFATGGHSENKINQCLFYLKNNIFLTNEKILEI